MSIKNTLKQLNFVAQCRRYNLSLWECPSFLTIVMGLLTIAAMFGTYVVANYYSDQPEISALIVIITTMVVFVIGYFIVRAFSYLAEANQMKAEFISITTHQLRTPLSSLKWSLNLLMDGKLCEVDKRQKEYLDIMQISNERMIKLVNDLLDVSRIEQGRFEMQPQKLSLVDMLQSLVLETSPIAQSKKLLLNVEKENVVSQAWADPDKLRMVAQNLLDNAIKYSEENGKINIKISQKGKFLKCEVRDSGVGIPTNQQAQIFQKFFRSENAKKYQTEGTGLGLFIAKAFTEATGGKIGFESKENQGSTFWFTVPIAK
jgi:signal transduction histidine kinase